VCATGDNVGTGGSSEASSSSAPIENFFPPFLSFLSFDEVFETEGDGREARDGDKNEVASFAGGVGGGGEGKCFSAAFPLVFEDE
jgi:hypothetical protein